MASGAGRRTSGIKHRPGVGTRKGPNFNKGPRMSEVTRGEKPTDPDAEIEAKRSDLPDDALPADAAAIRRRRGRSA